MKKRYITLVIFIAAIFSFVMTYFWLQKQKTVQIPANIHLVALDKDRAVPDFVSIHPGEYVQFESKDGASHILVQGQMTASMGSKMNMKMSDQEIAKSPVIHADEGYKVQFKQVGTYDFHDQDNPKITITVLVYKQSEKKK